MIFTIASKFCYKTLSCDPAACELCRLFQKASTPGILNVISNRTSFCSKCDLEVGGHQFVARWGIREMLDEEAPSARRYQVRRLWVQTPLPITFFLTWSICLSPLVSSFFGSCSWWTCETYKRQMYLSQINIFINYAWTPVGNILRSVEMIWLKLTLAWKITRIKIFTRNIPDIFFNRGCFQEVFLFYFPLNLFL